MDDIEYRANELLKTCCEAFICNACWIDLRENETTLNSASVVLLYKLA